MLIVEVILTIVAWIRGWKGYALIPLIIIFTIGFTAGFSSGGSGGLEVAWLIIIFTIGFTAGFSSGGSSGLEEDIAWLIIIDVIAIIVLIGMVIKKREKKMDISSAMRNIMYCTKCGTRNDSNAFRCINCGTIIQQIPPTDN